MAIFDIFGDGSCIALWEFELNTKDTGGKHDLNISAGKEKYNSDSKFGDYSFEFDGNTVLYTNGDFIEPLDEFTISFFIKTTESNAGLTCYTTKKDRIEHKKDVLNFSKFLQERIEFFNEVALGNHVSLKSEIEPNLKILFNEVELQRVCDNNISNAIKYGIENQDVIIKLYRDVDALVFEVISQGSAIANPKKLFDRFYREKSARGGFGIGLHIVKEICDKYGVAIEVKSQNSQNSFKYHFKELDENIIA